MLTGRDAPAKLNVDFGFRIRGPPNPFQDMVCPLGTGIGLRQVKCRGTTFQSSQMVLEREWAPIVCADHFVDGITKLKASIFDRDFRLGQRHECSIDESHIRHD
jgi:hypothetical protein